MFYFDAGDQNAHPLVPYFLAEAAGPSAVMMLARRSNGLAVLFENWFMVIYMKVRAIWCVYGGPEEIK